MERRNLGSSGIKVLSLDDLLPYPTLLELRSEGFHFLAPNQHTIWVAIPTPSEPNGFTVIASFPDLEECDKDAEEWLDEYLMMAMDLPGPVEQDVQRDFTDQLAEQMRGLAALFAVSLDPKNPVQ
jgi:hypothetical protein